MTTEDRDALFAKDIAEADAEEGDPELAHIKVDDLLCQLLLDLGYEKTVAAWRAVSKWYA